MHILFLTDNFPPEGNAPAARTYEHATRWVKAGHKVTVITCAPNFPEGKVFDGYKNAWYSKSEMDGIQVVRVKTYITANEGFAKRILDYLSFMVSGFLAGLFQARPDVVVATSPQFFCALAGWALAGVRRKPFIFELRDIWPASITAVGAMQDSLAIKWLEKIEMFLYRRATGIISVTRSFKHELVSRGVPQDKIAVVRNGVDLQQYQPAPSSWREKLGLDNKFVVGYLGTHGMAHGLEFVLAGVEKLKEHQDIVFLFAGGGAARAQLVKTVKEKGLTNVVLVDRQPKEEMPGLWTACDLSLVPLRNSPLFSTVIPSKIFESMAMGVPILMSLPEGEATEIISRHDCGQVIAPECPEVMVKAVLELSVNPKRLAVYRQNALAAALLYSRDALAQDMLTELERLSASKPL